MEYKKYLEAADIRESINELIDFKFDLENVDYKPDIKFGDARKIKTIHFDDDTFNDFIEMNIKFCDERIKVLTEKFDKL